jgi:hypothetical protein
MSTQAFMGVYLWSIFKNMKKRQGQVKNIWHIRKANILALESSWCTLSGAPMIKISYSSFALYPAEFRARFRLSKFSQHKNY